MCGGHAAPVLGGITLSAGASSWLQWSRSASSPRCRRGTSGRQAGCQCDLGAEGHAFFQANHPRHAQGLCQTLFRTLQCTSTRAGERYHSVPTALLDRWKTWFGSWYGSGMTAFSGLKATPFRQQHGSLSVRTRSPRVPLFIAPHVPRTAPGSRPVCHTAVQAPRRCGSGELYPVCALHFSVVHVARD